MTADDQQSVRQSNATRSKDSQWEQRLRVALWADVVVLCGAASLAMGVFNIHLTGALQRLVLLVTFVGFVLLSVVGPLLIIQHMRRKPAPNWSATWGIRSFVAGLFIALPCAGWLFFSLFLLPRSFSPGEGMVILGALLLALLLMCSGTMLIVAGVIADMSRQALSLWHGMRSNVRE
jgi:uncharacterized membrane protein HdeD (DUF308 family)